MNEQNGWIECEQQKKKKEKYIFHYLWLLFIWIFVFFIENIRYFVINTLYECSRLWSSVWVLNLYFVTAESSVRAVYVCVCCRRLLVDPVIIFYLLKKQNASKLLNRHPDHIHTHSLYPSDFFLLLLFFFFLLLFRIFIYCLFHFISF